MKIRNTALFLIGCLFALNSYAVTLTITSIRINAPADMPHFFQAATMAISDYSDPSIALSVQEQYTGIPVILTPFNLNKSIPIRPKTLKPSHPMLKMAIQNGAKKMNIELPLEQFFGLTDSKDNIEAELVMDYRGNLSLPFQSRTTDSPIQTTSCSPAVSTPYTTTTTTTGTVASPCSSSSSDAAVTSTSSSCCSSSSSSSSCSSCPPSSYIPPSDDTSKQ